jgi:D-sedoheptulose 7-phosphate isomerase
MIKKNHRFIENYFQGVSKISSLINKLDIERIVESLLNIRNKNGRVFFIGVGGSAANCSHAVNDFRKLCNIECYSPADNISEYTARANDEGLDSTFVGWLKVSNLNKKDALFILSVGGGNKKRKVSMNIVEAIKFAKKTRSKTFSIIGKNDGYAYKNSDEKILIPNIDNKLVTPYSEAFQAVIWHCIVSHPKLMVCKTKW